MKPLTVWLEVFKMSDFNYEIERTDHYSLINAILYGQSVQDGTPTPDAPVDVQVVQGVNGSIGLKVGSTITPIDLNGNVIASLPDGTKDVLMVDSVGHVVLGKRVAFANPKEAIAIGSSSRNQYVATRAPVNGTLTTSNENNIIGNRGVAARNAANVGNMYVTSAGNTIVLVFANNTFASVDEASAWLQANDTYFYYEMATPQTIDLGYIDVSHLQDIPAEIPISFVTSLTPDSSYLYENNPTYKTKNPYEDYNAPEYAYPPNHFGQEWETFDANDWNVSEMLDYTGQPESHAVYTVELCELMQSGAFNWSRPELDWSEAAYSQDQYERFCKYFEQRFMFREISMLPPLQWFTALKRMLVYELMPKYKPLYAQVENGISPLGENEYYKERHVSSSYPETLLSGNSDYISSGEDREFERIKIDNAAEALETYRNGFRSVDAALGDELEILFISMYTSFVNAF